jgi:hypothetical protein
MSTTNDLLPSLESGTTPCKPGVDKATAGAKEKALAGVRRAARDNNGFTAAARAHRQPSIRAGPGVPR